MTNSIRNLSSVIRTFRTANSVLRGEGKDSHILLEHIEAFLYVASKKEALMRDAQKDLQLAQAKTHRTFKHLQRLGWLTIGTDHKDMRQRQLKLTSDGLDFLAFLSYKLDR